MNTSSQGEEDDPMDDWSDNPLHQLPKPEKKQEHDKDTKEK